MYARTPIPEPLVRLAKVQHGVVTSEQCYALGVGRHALRRLIEQDVWRRLAPGVLFTAGPPVPWPALVWGGVLAGGDRALAAGWAAGHLWGLIKQPPDEIQILIPYGRTPRALGPWRFTRTRQLPRPFGDPPRTTLADTVLDLAVLDPDRTAVWINEAVHSRKVSAAMIRRSLDARPRQPHRKLIESMLNDQVEGIHSELERRYARLVERAHGLPTGRRQVSTGRYRVDVEYGLLIIELDGRLGHTGAGRFRDMTRDNVHALEGRITLRFGWQDVTANPCGVARQVASILTQQGWAGPLATCPRCRAMPV